MKAASILETIGGTPHIRVNRLFGDAPQGTEVWIKSERANPGGSIKDRIALAMVEAAVAGVPGLSAGRDEVDRAGPTYTVDTLEALRAAEPDTEVFLVLGTDAAAGLATWHRWEDLPGLATVVVVGRPGAGTGSADVPVPVVRVPVPQVELSSTELRGRVAAGRSLRFLVPDPVCAVVEERGLYGGPR